MKSENSNVKLLISEQAKNEITIEHAIEMVVMHAFEYGAKHVSDFVEYLTEEGTEEPLEKIVAGFADECREFALDNIDENFILKKHIQALEKVVQNAVSNPKIKKITCYEFD